MSTRTFTDAEFAYLDSQRVARLATVAPDGAPQNNPVGFRHNPELGTIDIYGPNMGATRRYRHEQVKPHVALAVDDLASGDPWGRPGDRDIRGWARRWTPRLWPGLTSVARQSGYSLGAS